MKYAEVKIGKTFFRRMFFHIMIHMENKYISSLRKPEEGKTLRQAISYKKYVIA